MKHRLTKQLWPSVRRAGLVAALVLGGCYERAEPATHFLPIGFTGEVLIVFDVPSGADPERRDGRRVYRIPENGILRTQFPPTYGWSGPLYMFIAPAESKATPIPIPPPSAILDIRENRAHPDIEILHYQSGTTGAPVPGRPNTFSSEEPCSVKFATFFVGTRSQFLDRTSRIDISEYLKRNPVECTPTSHAPSGR